MPSANGPSGAAARFRASALSSPPVVREEPSAPAATSMRISAVELTV
jgi:hypothetical protein